MDLIDQTELICIFTSLNMIMNIKYFHIIGLRIIDH